MKKFAVLQLTGCSGCEVSLLNADAWIDKYRLVYMPLVISAHDIPEVDILLISGGVRTDEDLHNLRMAVRRAKQVVPVGTCAISGGVTNLGDREEVRKIFLAEAERRLLPRILPKSHPVDAVVPVDRYLPGCPPTPELFMALLFDESDFKPSKIVCQECDRKKVKDMRPEHLRQFRKEQISGWVEPGICLINQGYVCVGTSTRGGCRAPCPRAGHPCVGCRGPSDVFIEKESEAWFSSIQRVFESMTDVPPEEIEAALRSPQMGLFLFQFSDYDREDGIVRPKEKML